MICSSCTVFRVINHGGISYMKDLHRYLVIHSGKFAISGPLANGSNSDLIMHGIGKIGLPASDRDATDLVHAAMKSFRQRHHDIVDPSGRWGIGMRTLLKERTLFRTHIQYHTRFYCKDFQVRITLQPSPLASTRVSECFSVPGSSHTCSRGSLMCGKV